MAQSDRVSVQPRHIDAMVAHLGEAVATESRHDLEQPRATPGAHQSQLSLRDMVALINMHPSLEMLTQDRLSAFGESLQAIVDAWRPLMAQSGRVERTEKQTEALQRAHAAYAPWEKLATAIRELDAEGERAEDFTGADAGAAHVAASGGEQAAHAFMAKDEEAHVTGEQAAHAFMTGEGLQQ